MLIDRPNVREGSYIQNARIAFGTSNPSNPDTGELFFRTDLGSLLAYNGSAWVEAGAVALASHTSDAVLHLSTAQNTLLDGLAATLTAAELNYVDGVTSPIQTQLNTLTTNLSTEITNRTNADTSLQSQITTNSGTFTSHTTDFTLHLTSAQNTWLDAVTASSAEVNYLVGVTSGIQAQFTTAASNLATHASDAALHLTSAQNTLLDGISGITFLDVNTLGGIQSYLSGLGSTTIASYFATLTNGKVNKSGGDTITGNLTMSGGAKITGLPIPTLDTDAASKAYVDALAGGIDWKQAVRAATTGAITLSGLQTVDGVALAHNDRVLVKDQAAPSANGIYLVNSGGAWSRAADYDTALEISQSAVYVLAGGSVNGRGSFVQTSNITTVGTDSITFTPFSGPVVNTAGNGITLGVNGTVAVKNGAGITFDGGANVTAAVYSGGGLMTTVDGSTTSTAAGAGLSLTRVGTAGTYRSVTTDVYGRVTTGTNPTTLAGYGITDAQPLSSDLSAYAALNTTGIVVRLGAGSIVTRSVNTTGAGISITNADGTGAGAITINSNATSSNTASTIVFRDSAGNFSAGTITANLTGSASNNVLKTSDTMTGTLSINSGGSIPLRLLTSSAGPWGIELLRTDTSFSSKVYNDGTRWNFEHRPSFAGATPLDSSNYTTYAPSTTGSGASGTWSISITGSATSFGGFSTASAMLDRGSVAAASQDTATSNGFYLQADAGSSSGLLVFSPGGSLGTGQIRMTYLGDMLFRNKTDSLTWTAWKTVLTSQNYNSYSPTLTGGGASGTWSINISGNAATVGGLSLQPSGVAAPANTILRTDGNGYAFVNYINSSTGNDENGVISQVIITNGTDNYYRKASIGYFTTAVQNNASGTWGINVTGAARYLTGANAFTNGSDGWFRSIGQAGWYNQDYAVGIYATEAGNVRTYNSANMIANGFYVGSTATGLAPLTGTYGSMNLVGTGNGYHGFYLPNAGGTTFGMYDGSGNGGNYDSSSGWHMYWNRSQGCLGLGGSSTAAGYRAYTNGNHYVAGQLTASGNVTAFSDRRLKTDIAPIQNALEKVEQLNGVSYRRVDTGEQQIGFIAQEVQEVVPEVVQETGMDGMLGLAYGNMTAVLVEAIKELNKQVQDLKAQVAELTKSSGTDSTR